jgi:hypothetical protein
MDSIDYSSKIPLIATDSNTRNGQWIVDQIPFNPDYAVEKRNESSNANTIGHYAIACAEHSKRFVSFA